MKNTIIKLVLVVIALTAIQDRVAAQLQKDHEIQFFAHRGSRFEFPNDENTLYAFVESYNAGARAFETDVRMNKDGELVLNHDDSLFRTCGVDLEVESLTSEECRAIKSNGGHPLCFCQDLVDFLADKEDIYFEWEIKTDKRLYTQAMLNDLCDKLYKMAMSNKRPSSRYLFTSFDKRAVQTMMRLHPDVTTTYIKSQPVTPEFLMEAYDMGIMRVSGRMEGTTRPTIKLAHKLGMHVSLWPVMNKDDFMLGAALGADGLCCDRFVEVGAWIKEALPFLTVKGIDYSVETTPQDVSAPKSQKNRTTQFFAHRGSRFEYVDNENTMYAFRESYYKDGARGFETDVRMTKDGDLILSHDESLYRTCGVDVQTEDLTTKQCKKILTKGGQPLALCQELVDFLADKEGMYVEFEIKTVKELYTQAKLDELCDKLYKMAMAKKPASSEYLFTSFDKRALQTMKRLHPDAILMMLKSQPASPSILMEAYDMGIKRVGCRMDGTKRSTIALAHKLGMIVSLWPGSTKEDFFLGAALGSDAMCCDRFAEVSKWAEEVLPFVNIKGVGERQQ